MSMQLQRASGRLRWHDLAVSVASFVLPLRTWGVIWSANCFCVNAGVACRECLDVSKLHVHVAGEYHFQWNIFADWLDYVAAVSCVVLTLFADVLLPYLSSKEEIRCRESWYCPRWAWAVCCRTRADVVSVCWSMIGAFQILWFAWTHSREAKCEDGWAASRGCSGATLGSSSCTESITWRCIVECIQSHFCCCGDWRRWCASALLRSSFGREGVSERTTAVKLQWPQKKAGVRQLQRPPPTRSCEHSAGHDLDARAARSPGARSRLALPVAGRGIQSWSNLLQVPFAMPRYF